VRRTPSSKVDRPELVPNLSGLELVPGPCDPSVCIFHGCYVLCYDDSVLRRKADSISGLFLDTTWRVSKPHVIAIFMALVRNVASPVAGRRQVGVSDVL
jgi:hypothetical protein